MDTISEVFNSTSLAGSLVFHTMDGPNAPGYWIGADGGAMTMMNVKEWAGNPADLRVYLPPDGWITIQTVMRAFPRWSGPHQLPTSNA